MLQELKMKSLKGHAASIIIALALAAGLLWGTGFGAFKAIGGPKPLDSLDVSELKGQYVEAEVYLLLKMKTVTMSVFQLLLIRILLLQNWQS